MEDDMQPIQLTDDGYSTLEIYLENQDPILDVRKGWLYSHKDNLFTVVRTKDAVYVLLDLNSA